MDFTESPTWVCILCTLEHLNRDLGMKILEDLGRWGSKNLVAEQKFKEFDCDSWG